MQPLISPVDHESRQNLYREENVATASESSPLLANNSLESVEYNLNTLNRFIISCLFFILFVGVIIAVYLLIEQRDVVPSEPVPMQLIPLNQWDPSSHSVEWSWSPTARHVIITSTNTDSCNSLLTCKKLLLDLKRQYSNEKNTLPYNFLISSNGLTFECLGWQNRSHLYSDLYNSSYVLALIGNFTTSPPSSIQILETLKLCDESVIQGYLVPTFDIIGKNGKQKSIYLFQSFMEMPQWNSNLSDNVY